MKIGIAQTKSLKGEIQQNIQNHLKMIRRAIELDVDLIVFPELSITSFEPELAQQLAADIEDSIFDSFQTLADGNSITIGVGMPIRTHTGIKISMLLFQSNAKRTVYSKQKLHSDELPYFTCGDEQVFLKIKDRKIAFGICYEAMQKEHFIQGDQKEVQIHIVSVAKPQNGIEKAYEHFPKMAREFQTPIMMSNSIGPCDNFLSAGQSAVWNDKGELVSQLDSENQGFLIYDIETDHVSLEN